MFSVVALSFASNLPLKCFIFIYQLIMSKNGAFNKHDNNVVCCTALGGLICNAITYIWLLHRNSSATLIDNLLGRNSEKLTRASSGILIDKLSDHQPYFIRIEGDNSYIKQPKYITVSITISIYSPENIKKFKNELISADILGNIDQNPKLILR